MTMRESALLADLNDGARLDAIVGIQSDTNQPSGHSRMAINKKLWLSKRD
jgi:hypothetical protein